MKKPILLPGLNYFHASSQIVQSLVGGILMGLTVAPVSAWFLAWIALVPLWIAVCSRRSGVSKNQPPAAILGLVWGIGYHGIALSWITGIHPMTWMGVPWLASLAIAFFCWLFITLWGAILVAIWATAMRGILNFRFTISWDWLRFAHLHKKIKPTTNLIIRNSYLDVLIGVALWCGLESLWTGGPMCWSSLSYTQSPHNLAILHLGQLSGPFTVTAAIVAVNGFIAEALLGKGKEDAQKETSPNWRYLSIAAGLLVGLHLVGFGLYSRPLIQSPATALKVGIIQGNIPNEIKLYPGGLSRALERYTSGYKTLASLGVDAVLTPETALPFLWSGQDKINSSFYSAILEKGVLAWVGALGEQGRSLTNSLFTVTGKGETFSRYDKVKLVPLGEYIPFEQFVGGLISRLSPLDAHLAAGKPSQVFDTPIGRAIVGICFESAFAEIFRYQAAAGGQFILTASNNAHYSKIMPTQHFAQDVMRAIETDRWLLSSTNTGYSGFIDPHGRIIWKSGSNTYEIHAATIYRRQTQTLYVRWGDWLTPLLLILGATGWLLNSLPSPIKN